MPIEDRYLLELEPGDLHYQDAPITPARWIENVRRVLTKIEGIPVGKMLLDSIRGHGAWVRIQPYWRSGHAVWPPQLMQHLTNPCNADTTSFGPAGHRDLKGRFYRSQLRISPERYSDGSACAKRHAAVAEDHEIFFHELVHALRHVSAKATNVSLSGGLRNHDNVEEFIAILVTNIYASHNGKDVLRAGHRDHKRLPGAFDGSFRFFEISAQTYRLVKQFYGDNKGFCELLKTVEAPFNPIRAYHRDPEKARQLSEGARAKNRDARADALTMLEKALWPLPSSFEELIAP